jgi:EAL domain-containing protein (putative c-di-GMP-specific phosphodiesterase class I)
VAAALDDPFVLEDFAMHVHASVGIATYPADGGDVDTLLQRADIAMYQAKRQHLDHVAYAAEFDHHSPARLALAGELRRALGCGELRAHYQPQVDLHRRDVTSVEALVRWQHPTLGLLAPASFIEVAEGTGLIGELTTVVLDQALEDRRRWAQDGLDLKVAVNVSVRSLLDRGFPAAIAGRLEATQTPPDRLLLEITESTIMADPDTVTEVLAELAGMGIELAIDDFGTGYSSLAYLRRLPVVELKIDRSFVRTMGSERGDAMIVTSTIELGHNLGLRVIAEGVEDAGVLDALALAGCDGAQGYHLARPLPAAELPRAVEGVRALLRPSSPAPPRRAQVA